MSDRRTTGPSVLGCALGFSWVGMGVGSFLAMWLFATLFDNADLPDVRHLQLLYGFVCAGLFVGIVAGVGTGVIYARRRRGLIGVEAGAINPEEMEPKV